MEDRDTPRLDIHCPVVFLGDHVIGKGTITNLSTAGCGIHSTTLLNNKNSLTVTVRLPGEEEPLMVGLAAVRWALGGKAGLEFIRLGPEGLARLRRYINENRTEG